MNDIELRKLASAESALNATIRDGSVVSWYELSQDGRIVLKAKKSDGTVVTVSGDLTRPDWNAEEGSSAGILNKPTVVSSVNGRSPVGGEVSLGVSDLGGNELIVRRSELSDSRITVRQGGKDVAWFTLNQAADGLVELPDRPAGTSVLACKPVSLDPSWYSAETGLVTIPETSFPVIGLKSPSGRYHSIEKDHCTVLDASVTVAMAQYLTYENVGEFAAGWTAYVAGSLLDRGLDRGEVIEILREVPGFTPADEGRVFQWNGRTGGGYVFGHFYRVDGTGSAKDCTAQVIHAVEPEFMPSDNLSIRPFSCYDWKVNTHVTLNMEGWSTSGEEWSTLYVRMGADGMVTGGDGVTLVNAMPPGMTSFCQVKGYLGKVRVYVLESYKE